MINVQRSDIRLKADPAKVILKMLDFGNPARTAPVITQVAQLEPAEVQEQLQLLEQLFAHRHYDLRDRWQQHFELLRQREGGSWPPFSRQQQQLIGAYFTHEYSVQAAALFNPSIVPHPDQSGLQPGELRFVMSLRATGEGHISSIAFRSGIVDAGGHVRLLPAEARLWAGKKEAAGAEGAAYDVRFPPALDLSSRILFPQSPTESNGMEDLRLLRFEDQGSMTYLGTYTAYDGRSIRPQLLETDDFLHFRIRPLRGLAASDKGMAIFPEKIGQRYAMIGRQGGRSLSIMYADTLYEWNSYQTLQQPQRSWELLQMGNCGSPVRTPQGWLLLTHAVGPMRRYVLAATLLDLDDPQRVIASTPLPLLMPNEEEREGYVPNVLYSCGMLLHGEKLVIPYAMSDSSVSFATVTLSELLASLH
jgi:predicted GH43/DUF377 family glycosyl hydrolase